MSSPHPTGVPCFSQDAHPSTHGAQAQLGAGGGQAVLGEEDWGDLLVGGIAGCWDAKGTQGVLAGGWCWGAEGVAEMRTRVLAVVWGGHWGDAIGVSLMLGTLEGAGGGGGYQGLLWAGGYWDCCDDTGGYQWFLWPWEDAGGGGVTGVPVLLGGGIFGGYPQAKERESVSYSHRHSGRL